MTRDDYLALAKWEALGYLPSNPIQAMDSLKSDLAEHEELKNHARLLDALPLYLAARSPWRVRKWIEGFK